MLFDREIVRILNNALRDVSRREAGCRFRSRPTSRRGCRAGRSARTCCAATCRRGRRCRATVQFVNDNSLTLRETQFLVSWVEGLGPRNAGTVFLNVVDPKAAGDTEIRAHAAYRITGNWASPTSRGRCTPIAIEAQAIRHDQSGSSSISD